ncbi:hypothetical protein CWB72_14590 [Pseudoalteromonas phenolica]|uniref:hypothetical protein n=1 Tax=Pseudoalteromonas phenolica TaxID=161398 RepID=UPI00110BA53B|nr:hypothetical protein [Pseudoalteromonas phenolica]TMN87860.1 hypothetical protein CWB72_14590 [Pseudoalteromonas phenolica]
MEALSEYLNYFTYAPLPIFVFALLKCWKNIGARWFLTLLISIECIDIYSYQYSIEWTTHYYVWSAFMCTLFFVPSFFRRKIALNIYRKTNSKYFLDASKLDFSQQEAALLLLFFTSMCANLISYIEILMYKNYIIDVIYFKLYILDKLQLIIHTLVCLAALSFAIKPNKGQDYETASDS